MNNREHDNRDDGLRELESMLEKDLRGSQPALKGSRITREQLRRALIRLGISAALLLLVFFLGVFREPSTVLLGIALVALLEGVLLFLGHPQT